jgi:dTDP-4-dehydrorhamnose 3,5-epimerase-like enzyme
MSDGKIISRNKDNEFREASINSIKLHKLETFQAEKSTLNVIQEPIYQRDIKRFFFVHSSSADDRGNHAHKLATQWMVCLRGEVIVIAHDGGIEVAHLLDNPNKLLEIPPGVWTKQSYAEDTILFVSTDFEYDEAEYIRDWFEFMTLKGLK